MTIDPPPGWACITSLAACATCSGAIRFSSMILAWNRGEAVAASASGEPPALLTTTSTPPNSSMRGRDRAAGACSGSRTSAWVKTAGAGRPRRAGRPARAGRRPGRAPRRAGRPARCPRRCPGCRRLQTLRPGTARAGRRSAWRHVRLATKQTLGRDWRTMGDGAHEHAGGAGTECGFVVSFGRYSGRN